MGRWTDGIRRTVAESGLGLVPLSTAWYAACVSLPEVDPYKADGAHALLAGSYLVPCLNYGQLAGRSPMGSDVSIEVGREELVNLDPAAALQVLA